MPSGVLGPHLAEALRTLLTWGFRLPEPTSIGACETFHKLPDSAPSRKSPPYVNPCAPPHSQHRGIDVFFLS